MRIKAFFFLSLVLAIFIFSFNKILFFIDLNKISLNSDRNYPKLLARNYYKNERISPLLEMYLKDGLFLSYLGKEFLRNYELKRSGNEKKFFLPLILEKFPENILLDELNLYSTKDSARDWGNFDLLFLKILEDSDFNSFSNSALIESIKANKISKEILFLLICYLNWAENFSLSESVTTWGIEENIFTSKQQRFLLGDLSSRKGRRENFNKDNKSFKYSSIQNKLNEMLEDDEINVKLGKNLIPDGHLTQKDSANINWHFSDMSDGELFSKGSFYGDLDQCEKNSLRVMCFYTKRAEEKEPSRGGFWFKKDILLERATYLFYFRYRTVVGTENATFWLSSISGKEPILESTDSDWKECFYIFNNEQLKMPKIKPLLRMWNKGSVWFDDIGFFKLDIGGTLGEKDLLFIR